LSRELKKPIGKQIGILIFLIGLLIFYVYYHFKGF